MVGFAKVGTFCPNPVCPDYEQVRESGDNIIKFGHTGGGRQRFKCRTCKGTFTETRGTIFYRRRTTEKEILECLAMIAEGSRISSVSRIKGHKEDTISDWLRDAAEHTEKVEDILISEFQITRGQIDGLWSYVANKGQKKRTSRRTSADCFRRVGRYTRSHGRSVWESTWLFRERQVPFPKTAAAGMEISTSC